MESIEWLTEMRLIRAADAMGKASREDRKAAASAAHATRRGDLHDRPHATLGVVEIESWMAF